ncbi:MAG TPA: hypothetical protein VL576_00935 [Candidatus Paceibacterota bacterium]|nr:hypothetical protein [Candidatus Paceibacterota bacterium]
MKWFYRYSYIFFILTYVFLALWLFKGIGQNYSFCLSNRSSYNVFGVLTGISALLTIPAYVTHEKLTMKAFDLFTILVGLSALVIVCYRFFMVIKIC